MPNINASYIWAVNTCNAPNVGYNMDYRNQKTVDGITYYDCSSFIWYSLIAGGFQGLTGWPFTTDTMRSKLLELGFVQVPVTGLWMPGDVAWRTGHTEMVYQANGTGDGYTMGAHGRKNIALPNQVSINSKPMSQQTHKFTEFYRYGSGASGAITYTWIRDSTQYRYFTEEEKQNNAACILQFFYPRGWTLQAIAGLCGNIDQESTFNPDLIEHGGTGHGLVQWTPPSDLYAVLDVLYGNHSDWGDPDGQCNVIWAEYEEATGLAHRGIEKQWYTTFPISIDMSWDEWAHSTEDPGYLAEVFQRNYERPAAIHPERQEKARKWYDYLLTIDPYGGGANTGTKKGLKIWQMIKYHY